MQIPSHIASQLYTDAQTATKTDPSSQNKSGDTSFAELAATFIDSMRANEEIAKAGLVGKADAQAVVEALAATEIAVQTAVTVRDKVVEAYQEILRMPV